MKTIILLFSFLILTQLTFSQWQTVYFPTTGVQLPNVVSVSFTDINKGMAAGSSGCWNPIIIRSYNNGTNWDTCYYLTTDSIHFEKILLIDSLTAFTVGKEINYQSIFNKGIIARTINFGLTWDTIKVNNVLYSLDFPSLNTGYVVGARGTIYKTTNNGNNWQQLNPGIQVNFNTVQFMNDTVGFIIGDSLILKTTDGGNSWGIKNFGYGVEVYSLFFPSDSIGFCLSYGNYTTVNIYKTIDCGSTWNFFSSYNIGPLTPITMYFTDNNIGYIAGVFLMAKTNDGGFSWNMQISSPPSSGNFYDAVTEICFINNDTGFAIGPQQFYRTFNSGEPTSINDLDLNVNQSYVFPNPFVYNTTINFKNPKHQNITFSLYDSMGKLINQQNNIQEEKINIEKKHLCNGVYFYNLFSSSGIIGFGKIIID